MKLSQAERGTAFRQAAAFLLHWQDPLSGGEGEAEILAELGINEFGVFNEQTGFVCALARLAWQMAKAADTGGIEEAAQYVRNVAAYAALDEVTGAPGAGLPLPPEWAP